MPTQSSLAPQPLRPHSTCPWPSMLSGVWGCWGPRVGTSPTKGHKGSVRTNMGLALELSSLWARDPSGCPGWGRVVGQRQEGPAGHSTIVWPGTHRDLVPPCKVG